MEELFLSQNEIAAATLLAGDVEGYAEHHAGGLIVLLRHLDNGWLVKLHDSWGADEEVVVHRYDPNADDPEFSDTEEVWAFQTGAEAFRFFKEVTAP